jgi:ATP-dependent DNA ligase
MLLLRTESLPDGGGWLLELKLDRYRAVAFKTSGKVHLRSPQRQGVQRQVPGHREGPCADTG